MLYVELLIYFYYNFWTIRSRVLFFKNNQNQKYCGSLVLFDENIFTSSVLPMYIKKGLLHLIYIYKNKKNKKNCCGHWFQ